MLCTLSYLQLTSETEKSTNALGSILLKLIPLVNRSISTNGTNVYHSVAEFKESTPLFRNFQIRDVLENEVDQLLVFLFSDPLNEAIASKRFPQAVGCQAILGEAVVEEGGNAHARGAKLFLLLIEVGSANLNLK